MSHEILFDFQELPLAGLQLYAYGRATIEYSDTFSGFIVRSVTLDPHEKAFMGFSPAPTRLDANSVISAAIIKALETVEVDAIEDAIREDQEEREASDRENRGRPLQAAE